MGVGSSNKVVLETDESNQAPNSEAESPKLSTSDHQKKTPNPSASTSNLASSSDFNSLTDSQDSGAEDLDAYLAELSSVKNALALIIEKLMVKKQQLGLSDENMHILPMQNIEESITVFQYFENALKALAKQFFTYLKNPAIVIAQEEIELKEQLDFLRTHRNPIVTTLNNKDITAEDRKKNQAQLLAIDLAMARNLQNFLIEMEREIVSWINTQKIAVKLAINLLCFIVRTVTGLTPPADQMTNDNDLKARVERDIEPEKIEIDDFIADTEADINEDQDLIDNTLKFLTSSGSLSDAAQAAAQLYAGTHGIKMSRLSSPVFARPLSTAKQFIEPESVSPTISPITNRS